MNISMRMFDCHVRQIAAHFMVICYMVKNVYSKLNNILVGFSKHHNANMWEIKYLLCSCINVNYCHCFDLKMQTPKDLDILQIFSKHCVVMNVLYSNLHFTDCFKR